ncbi:MAG TPA: DUF5052 family protein [Candidatus Saccharimonadales bacterium]
MKRFVLMMTAVVLALVMTSCSAVVMSFEDLARDWKGIPATMTTYDQNGDAIDKVVGESFQFDLDERFREISVSSDGNTVSAPGSVLLISIGNSHINHVGSSMLLAEKGVTAVAGADTTVDIKNAEPGVPWLNNFLEYNRNLWQGKGKTIMIRSQDGKPIAVFAADQVEIQGTAVPKSTMLRLDGKRLLAYRVDYTIYDNELLAKK